MKKIYSKFCIISGTMLILSALSLVLYNINQDVKSRNSSEIIMSELKNMVPSEIEEENFVSDTHAVESEEISDNIYEKTIEIDGKFYIGFIEIPSLNLELPVMSEWSYDNLKISPCRYKGSINENNLIIAAHNYSSHFGNIEKLNSGDIINFTDTDGIVYKYEVVHTEFIDGQNVSEMEENNDEWNLTVFTCTLSGKSRVTVRAVRISDLMKREFDES